MADVIGTMVGGDVPVEQRCSRTAELLELSMGMVEAALAYYADYTNEIDVEIAARAQAAEEAETDWRHQRVLLAK